MLGLLLLLQIQGSQPEAILPPGHAGQHLAGEALGLE